MESNGARELLEDTGEAFIRDRFRLYNSLSDDGARGAVRTEMEDRSLVVPCCGLCQRMYNEEFMGLHASQQIEVLRDGVYESSVQRHACIVQANIPKVVEHLMSRNLDNVEVQREGMQLLIQIYLFEELVDVTTGRRIQLYRDAVRGIGSFDFVRAAQDRYQTDLRLRATGEILLALLMT